MHAIHPSLALGVLLSACTLAQAGQHHICYETPPVSGQLTGVVGCREDAGGSCSIQGMSPGMASTGQWLPNAPPGTFEIYRFQGSAGTFTARITFTDAAGMQTTQDCEINARGLNFGNSGYGTPGAELTGFMTDSSGLLSTAVWRLRSAEPSSTRRQTLMLPSDLVAVGGGVLGSNTPYGALVVESAQPDLLGGAAGICDWRCWTTRTADLGATDPHVATTYAIGMRINGLQARDLKLLLRSHHPGTSPSMSEVAMNQVMLPLTKMFGGPTVVLSGSVKARADASTSTSLLGQYVTVSAPVLQESYPGCTANRDCKPGMPAAGWRAESTDHDFYHPGYVDTAILGLPSAITVKGKVWRLRSASAQATSALASHPYTDVSTLPQGYALTGIGAQVDWCCNRPRLRSPVGNLLWQLEPRTDLPGASVASKDHLLYSPAIVTGYALGLRLE